MTAYVQQTPGKLSVAANFLPVGIPGDGDTIQRNGHSLEIDISTTLGVDDGSSPTANSAQFPGPELEAAPVFVTPGVTLNLYGTPDNKNGDLQVPPGAKVVFLHSHDAILEFGGSDNASLGAPELICGGEIEHAGSGSTSLVIKNGGGYVCDGARIYGFGSDTRLAADITMRAGDEGQRFISRPTYFIRSKNAVRVRCWGDELTGDIELSNGGLFMVDPVQLPGIAPFDEVKPGVGIYFDGSLDTQHRPSTKKRIFGGIRSMGSLSLRHLQDFTEFADMRTNGGVVAAAGDVDTVPMVGCYIGNTNGSFMRAVSSMIRCIIRDRADNPHLVSWARLKSARPEMRDCVTDPKGVQDSSDTGDSNAADAFRDIAGGGPFEDFTVDGQIIRFQGNLQLPSEFSGRVDGAVFFTWNGDLRAGQAAQFSPGFEFENNTLICSNGGVPFRVNEAGRTPANSVRINRRNIFSNIDGQGRASAAAAPINADLLLVETDIFDPANSDENCYHNFPNKLGLPMSVPSDQNSDHLPPIFVDPTRNFRTWAESQHGATEEEVERCIVLAGFPGYTPVSGNGDPIAPISSTVYNQEDARQWIRAGWVDTRPEHAGWGIQDEAPISIVADPTPIVDQNEETFDLSEAAVLAELTLYNPETSERTTATLRAKPDVAKELAFVVQGNHAHGVDVQVVGKV